MANYFDRCIYLYGEIPGIAYWETHHDGTPWTDPYDGLLWDNKDIAKPSKAELDALDDATVNEKLGI